MSRLQIIDAKKMEKLLFKLGFKRVRQKGSHVLYRHPDGRTTSVPHHRGRDLARPLINLYYIYYFVPIDTESKKYRLDVQ